MHDPVHRTAPADNAGGDPSGRDVALAASGEPNPLRRRAVLGVLPEAHDPRIMPVIPGVRIAGVQAGGPAEAAGLQVGDLLTHIGDIAISTPDELKGALRQRGEPSYPIRFCREGRVRQLEVPYRPADREVMAGGTVHYTHITVAERRLRALVTLPTSERACVAALVFVMGVGKVSVDTPFAATPLASLCSELTAQGVMTVRVDRPGVGDSEGESLGDLADEVAIVRASLELVDSFAAGAKRFVFGISLGGMIAPLAAAAEPGCAGILVYGTSILGWEAWLRRSAERQLALGIPLPADGLEEWLRDDAGRPASFASDLAGANLGEVWASLRIPVQVMVGEYDWVAGPEEASEVGAKAGCPVLQLPGLDHAFTKHASLAESVRAYGKGARDLALPEAIVSFLTRQS